MSTLYITSKMHVEHYTGCSYLTLVVQKLSSQICIHELLTRDNLGPLDSIRELRWRFHTLLLMRLFLS